MNRDINEYFDDTEVYGGKMKSVSSTQKGIKNKTRSKQNKTFRTTRRKRDN